MTAWVSRKELAEYLGVSIATISNWRSRGVITDDAYFKTGGTVRYDRDAVEQAVRGQQLELPLEEATEVDPRSFYRPKGGNR